jgi:hypothetical protein
MNLIKITFLLTCLTLLLVAMGSALGGQAVMLVALAVAGGMNLCSSWYSNKIILKNVPSPGSLGTGAFRLSWDAPLLCPIRQNPPSRSQDNEETGY